MSNKYREYFDIDERYFPCIDDSAINAGAPWENTYPHSTFIDLLLAMERALSRQEKKSLWIEGAYGTGKSQCAYALKKILEVPEKEVRAYWDSYEPLKKHKDLLEKYIGHKEKGIITAHRYASGGIMSPRDLFFAVQESISAALEKQGLEYRGENTLKESVIAWIEKSVNSRYFDDLLRQPEWASLFSQSTADDVLNALKKGGEIKSLMSNIFRMADKEGITALNIDSDRLIAWLTDVIDENDVKIVLIWDEFSDYFRNNRESLSEFQKLAALVQNKPFYFIVVTHESQQIYISESDRGNRLKVSDRFISVPITMPDNIAFNLIGHAFNVKPSARTNWEYLASDLNSRLDASQNAVMKVTRIGNIQVMKNIMPLHPMTALVLKNIASSFKSNQRSMFDFIKSPSDKGVKAFQWFIENTGPRDDHPLLTVDMLWDFFYEKGKDNLTSDIRQVLDTFSQQQGLREDEERVLKAVLIMQAVDQRLSGALELLKPTDQNLSYVFEGIAGGLDASSKNIAKQLKDNGILVSHSLGGGRTAYGAAVLAGDQVRIDNLKKEVRQSGNTSKLVTEGSLSTVLGLSPALRLRFETIPGTGEITPVTVFDFKRTINSLTEKDSGWNFHAVIAFAKDETEAASFRNTIKATVTEKKYADIVFIDALSTPLGPDAFEQYVEFSAMTTYYSGNNNASSREYSDKARRVLDQDWKNRIYNGQFIVYTYENQQGEKFSYGHDVASILQGRVVSRFPKLLDFEKNLTENQLKLTSPKQAARCGISQKTSGAMVGAEKYVLAEVWNVEKYWEAPVTASLNISKIKLEVDRIIETSFLIDGQIGIGDVYDYLEGECGFAPCNLSAFITGFLLKEFGGEPYRYSDSSGSHEPMTEEKLAEMIGNYIGKSPKPKPTYIVKMTAEERAFYELTEKAWGIEPDTCSSATQAASSVAYKMRALGLPAWTLAEVDEEGVYDVVQKYIDLVKAEGVEAHKMSVSIGKTALARPSLDLSLRELISAENCQKGMKKFLLAFEDGRILRLAEEIGAKDNMLSDIRRLFEVKHSCLWEKQTGENEIRRLLTEYGIVKVSNGILNVSARSMSGAFKCWRERLKFYSLSSEALKEKVPSLSNLIGLLLRIFQNSDILPEQQKSFLAEITDRNMEMRELLNDEIRFFSEIYKPYLFDLSLNEVEELKSKLPNNLFERSITECNGKVKTEADNFRKNQLKTKMLSLWNEKTKTKNPQAWSNINRTPILCCVAETEFSAAKKTFDTINRGWGTDAEVKGAIAFLNSTSLFETLADSVLRDAAFEREIVGEYGLMLPDLDRIRTSLESLAIEGDAYGWYGNPIVKNKVKQLAEAEYNAGGSDRVLSKIDEMDNEDTKSYLKRLVRESMIVGLEILAKESEK